MAVAPPRQQGVADALASRPSSDDFTALVCDAVKECGQQLERLDRTLAAFESMAKRGGIADPAPAWDFAVDVVELVERAADELAASVTEVRVA